MVNGVAIYFFSLLMSTLYNQIILGDCLEIMPNLETKIDAIITDPPYGITNSDWDEKFDLGKYWKTVYHLCKSTHILFAAQPFTTDLINSDRRHFRYSLVWKKASPVGFLGANKRPLRIHEDICIFGQGKSKYNPQKTLGKPYKQSQHSTTVIYGKHQRVSTINKGDRYPTSVLEFPLKNQERGLHPTQKPLELLRWLVRTYTDLGDVILDPFVGSGTTCLAALQEGRRFVGIERNSVYHQKALVRLASQANAPQELVAQKELLGVKLPPVQLSLF